MIAALVHAADVHRLPVEELRPYMASMRMDCGPLRIQTREELERYMDGSGASVGRIMAVILGAPEESERLGRLGVAFQLTNFLRDLREDYALDRIYLPADERERHGVGEDDLAADSASPALRSSSRRTSVARAGCFARRRLRCSRRSRPRDGESASRGRSTAPSSIGSSGTASTSSGGRADRGSSTSHVSR